MALDFNMSNFTTDWSYYAFRVYFPVFFGFFWDIFFLVIAGYIYYKSDKNSFETGLYLLGTWCLIGGIFSTITLNAIGLICALIFTGLFMAKIGEKRRWW